MLFQTNVGRPDKPFRVLFEALFKGVRAVYLAYKSWKLLRKRARNSFFGLPTFSFGMGISSYFVDNRTHLNTGRLTRFRDEVYAPQTTILEG